MFLHQLASENFPGSKTATGHLNIQILSNGNLLKYNNVKVREKTPVLGASKCH